MNKHYESIVCDPSKIADIMNEKLEKGVSEVKFLNGVTAINTVGQPVFIALLELEFETEENKNLYVESKKPKSSVLQ
jgi:hypothetical protein